MMILMNKYVATKCSDHFVILCGQALMTVILNCVGIFASILLPPKPFTLRQVVTFTIPSCIFAIMLYTSMKGLPHVAVGTVIVFRAVSTVLVAVADRFIFGRADACASWRRYIITLVGATLYGLADLKLTFDPFGYMALSCNSVLFVMNHVYEKYAISGTDQTPEGIAII